MNILLRIQSQNSQTQMHARLGWFQSFACQHLQDDFWSYARCKQIGGSFSLDQLGTPEGSRELVKLLQDFGLHAPTLAQGANASTREGYFKRLWERVRVHQVSAAEVIIEIVPD